MADVGRRPSKALFFGQTDDDSQAIYSLENFHDVFVECEDVTEYRPAIQLIGSWTEWERIKRDWPAFRDYLALWIEEIETKLTSKALQKIQDLAKSDDKSAFQAAKFLATKEYKRRVGPGKPSKAEQEREIKAIARAASETVQEERRMLRVLNGGVHDSE